MQITITSRMVSWNDLYSSPHWSVRANIANDWHLLVRAAIGSNPVLFTKPVNITTTAHFKRMPQDPDNICDKLVIDGLKGILIEDDTYYHVHSTTTISKKSDNKTDYVTIDIEEIE